MTGTGKPCEYKFKRYIGQRVTFGGNNAMTGYTGEIVEMLPYYTIVNVNGRRYAAGPCDIYPESV